MSTPEPAQCFDLAPSICGRVVVDFPIWEVLVSVLITALVTYLTIRWSVKAATRETQSTIDANIQSEQRAAKRREEEAAEAARAAANRERIALAATLSRGVHELEPLLNAKKTDPQRIAAVAQWRSMRTAFATSSVDDAIDLYTYADLRFDQSQNGGPRPKEPVDLVAFLIRKQFAEAVSTIATEWARTGELPEVVVTETPKLQEDKRERRDAWLRDAVKQLNIDIPTPGFDG